jgi:hypothetical protein
MIKDLTDITDDWDTRYNTNAFAVATEFRKVKNATVIKVKNGFYRGSEINGMFEVAKPEDPVKGKRGKLKVEVLCGWFGMKPRTTWIHIKLTGKWELIEGYSGEVTLNFS